MSKDPVTVATVAALDEREKRWTDELLDSAKERLKFGWTQGSPGETLGGGRQWKTNADSFAFCVLGALSHAATTLGADVYTLRRAERLVAETIRSEGWSGPEDGPRGLIAAWNDDPDRSKADVIALVERVLGRRVFLNPRQQAVT